MIKKESYGLIAIDGTDSYNISGQNVPKITHVFHFYQAFAANPDYKFYSDGPRYKVTGFDAGQIAWRAAAQGERIFSLLRKHGIENPRLCIVGWSRGAMIAIRVANLLRPFGEVYFLGLWDTVDMSVSLSVEPVENAKHVFHAKRSLAGSRQWSMRERHTLEMVATGKKIKCLTSSKHDPFPTVGGLSSYSNLEAYFDTSHGGSGGGMEKFKPEGWFDDHTPWQSQATLNRAREEEVNAYRWIREGATRLGVPIHY